MGGYVLIVDSDADRQRQIATALEDAGFELAAETEAAWAKRSIAARLPDVVLVGTALAGGGGFRLADELRRDPATRTTPIVFIASTHRGASHRAEARRRFAPAEYLPTPIDLAALVPRVQELAAIGAADVLDADALVEVLDDEPAAEPTPPPAEPLHDPAQQRERRDVERSAKHLVADPAQAAFQGTLKRTPFPRLLRRLYAEQATGQLLLLRDAADQAHQVKKIVSFVGGYPVAVRSNIPGETLGQILLDRRLITREAYTESVRRMQKEKRQHGQILVEMGALSPFNLERALAEQADAKLFELFAWSDGRFMFKAGGDVGPGAATSETVRLERAPAAVMREGIRRHYDAARQQAALARLADHRVVLASDPVLRLQEITADPRERAFIESIDGTRRLEELLQQSDLPAEKARLLLIALSEAGIIEPAEGTVKRRRGAERSAETAAEPSGPALGSDQLAMMLQTVRTQDHFWVLGVEPDAGAPDVERAYEALARSFHPDRYHNAPEDDRKVAQEIFDRLTEAHRTLRDPARRKAYVGRLAKAAAAPESIAADRVPARPEAAPPAETTPPAALRPASSSGSTPPNATAQALYDAGLEHLRARRHHEAVEALRQAARLVPNEADYRAALGWALFRQAPADARAGRAAIAELRRALQIDQRHRGASQRLAEIYAQTGQPDQAIAELERLISADPDAQAVEEIADELRRLRSR